MRLSPLFFRRVHKWIGLVLGLQFVLWTLSGAMMSMLDHETVAGGHAAEAQVRLLPAPASAWPRVGDALGDRQITGVSARQLLDRHVLEVATADGRRLFDAITGAAVDVDAALAQKAAEAAYTGSGPVTAVHRLDDLELAVREHRLPIWRIDFADDQNSSFYVSGETGEVLERRNDTWRTFDFFWMLHNMDYLNRTSFNHPLIVLVGFGVLWLAITGFYLLFKTAWRQDLRWLRRRG